LNKKLTGKVHLPGGHYFQGFPIPKHSLKTVHEFDECLYFSGLYCRERREAQASF